MSEWYEALIDNGLVPDFALRFGIRLLSRVRISSISQPTLEKEHEAKMQYIQRLRESPIAIHTDKANEQHYEVLSLEDYPYSFLGPNWLHQGMFRKAHEIFFLPLSQRYILFFFNKAKNQHQLVLMKLRSTCSNFIVRGPRFKTDRN